MVPFLLTFLLLLVTNATSQLIEQAHFFSGTFSLENTKNGGVLSDDDINTWEKKSAAFWAHMYQKLSYPDELEHPGPLFGVGVELVVVSQEAYKVEGTNNNFGTTLAFQATVAYQSTSLEHNPAFLTRNLFDLKYFSAYLNQLRNASNGFNQLRKLSMNLNAGNDIDLVNPIPTMAVITQSPTIVPTITRYPTKAPTFPTKAPTPSPTGFPTKTPSISPSTSPTITPTATPTTLSPTSPGDTKSPTTEPSNLPTPEPTNRIETYYATKELVLEGVSGALSEQDSVLFTTVMADFMLDYIERVLPQNTRFGEIAIQITKQTPRRHLEETVGNSGELTVEFNSVFNIGLPNVNSQSLLNGAFATFGRREEYRELLQASGSELFQSITKISLPDESGNDDDDDTTSGKKAMSVGVIVGIALGAIMLVIAIAGIWVQSNRQSNDDSSQKQLAQTAQSGDDIIHQKRLDAEIRVQEMHDDDISTLGDPFFGNVAQEDQTCADKTANESVTQNYDYLKLLGKKNLLGSPEKEDGDETEEELTLPRNTLFAEDDASFEELFGDA